MKEKQGLSAPRLGAASQAGLAAHLTCVLMSSTCLQVPEYQPRSSLEFLTRWLRNDEYQKLGK